MGLLDRERIKGRLKYKEKTKNASAGAGFNNYFYKNIFRLPAGCR
jgi:hypothetical protein